MKDPFSPITVGGITLGILIGVVIGMLIGNVTMGIAVGVAIGIALGGLREFTSKDGPEDDAGPPEERREGPRRM